VLLEVQPLLVDVARGAAAVPDTSSSGSSSDEDEAAAAPPRPWALQPRPPPRARTPPPPAALAAAAAAGAGVPEEEAAAAANYISAHSTRAPAGGAARVLIDVSAAAAADGVGLPALAAAAVQELALVTARLPGGLAVGRVASARSWCVQGLTDAGAWGGALAGALATVLPGGSSAGGSRLDVGGAAGAVVSVPVAGAWVCGGDEVGAGRECCIAFEALLWCG
jgi:hypothetical protein